MKKQQLNNKSKMFITKQKIQTENIEKFNIIINKIKNSKGNEQKQMNTSQITL